MTGVVVMALCNQPHAFASDLGDDQSRYLFNSSATFLVEAEQHFTSHSTHNNSLQRQSTALYQQSG